jgi:hypothetical protein
MWSAEIALLIEIAPENASEDPAMGIKARSCRFHLPILPQEFAFERTIASPPYVV